MIQNFKPIEWGQREESNNPPHDSDHTACSTPNPPWWCENNAQPVNVDAYIPIMILVAIILGLIKLRNKYGKRNLGNSKSIGQ